MGEPGLLAAATALVEEASSRDPWLRGLRLAAIGWATVELERAAEELAEAFHRAGLPAPDWEPAPRDPLLGASAWVSRAWWPAGGTDDPPAIAILEPDTEGRLAAALARSGEGVAATWLAARPADPAHAASGVVDPGRVGAPAAGPLGRARLVLARPAWGPHVLVLDP